jgi:hypothetical protein
MKDLKPVHNADKILTAHMGIPTKYISEALKKSYPDNSFASRADYKNGMTDALEKFWVILAQIVKERKLKTKLVMEDNQ